MVETSLQLQPGDHIFAIRRFKGYSHHGIKSSKNPACQVCGYDTNIHYGVVKTCLDCFLSGDSLQVKDYNGNSKPSYEVVQTAYRLLQDGFGEYELIMKNCEHFATFCKTGKTQSAQVDKAIDIAFERLVLPAAPIVESVFVLSKLLRSQFGIKTLIRR
ncbi:uncharacterized protein LOC105630359 isoform X2 [Jatropha curcas]|uniref:uncharacterized protein LOC105630359 isoform X2 n=1 Tax=Jatropha curcas TaxID=180498 RepID=UPI0009D6FD2D|nr:uncharacterized protein LOC105630359 isoform X2 [Jatropha curcas]